MRKVCLEFPYSKIKVTATLQEENEKELVNKFWESANGQPLLCTHPLSAGYSFNGVPIPTPDVPYLKPENPLRLCTFQSGQLHYNGHCVRCTYGKVTEPLLLNYAYVAEIDEDCKADYEKACMDVWELLIHQHKAATFSVTKVED